MLGKLSNKIHNGIDLEQDIWNYKIVNKRRLSTEQFLPNIEISFLKCGDQDNVWHIAFSQAINNEYTDMIAVMNRFRIACFTTSPYMINMWSYQYADNNRGFCIEYEMPDMFRRTDELCNNLFSVIYSDARTDVLNKCLEYNEKKPDKEYLSVIYKYGVLANGWR